MKTKVLATKSTPPTKEKVTTGPTILGHWADAACKDRGYGTILDIGQPFGLFDRLGWDLPWMAWPPQRLASLRRSHIIFLPDTLCMGLGDKRQLMCSCWETNPEGVIVHSQQWEDGLLFCLRLLLPFLFLTQCEGRCSQRNPCGSWEIGHVESVMQARG